MKVLLLNGSPHEKGCTYTALMEVVKVFAAEAIDYEVLQLGKGAIHGCTACLACKSSGSSRCVFADDLANPLIAKLQQADAIIVGSPVYYAGIAGQLKSLLDRVFFAGSGYAGKLAAAVVSCRRGGASAAFDQLNHYFLMSNMHIVASQYWNQVHGFTPADVEQDLEGLQTMRTLGQNMAWLLKSIEAGQKSGLAKPQLEAWTPTNFIR